MHGQVFLIATDKDGNVKQTESSRNLIVDQGVDILLHGLFSGAGYTARYLGIGSSPSFQTADVSITQEYLSLVATDGTESRVTMLFNQNASSSMECTMEATCQFGVAYTALAGGIYVASDYTNNTNSIFAKATFASIALACTDKLTVRWVFCFHCTQSQ